MKIIKNKIMFKKVIKIHLEIICLDLIAINIYLAIEQNN